MVRDAWDDVAGRRIQRIARLFGTTAARVRAAWRFLSSLSPFPAYGRPFLLHTGTFAAGIWTDFAFIRRRFRGLRGLARTEFQYFLLGIFLAFCLYSSATSFYR